MENTFGVRRALPVDEQRVYDHLMILHSENGLAPVDENKVWTEIRQATHGDGGIIGLIEGPKGIEGSIGLKLSSFWYTSQIHWEERWVYVCADYRRTTHAKRLIGFAKWCADEMTKHAGVPVNLYVGIMTFKALEPKMRLYQRSFQQIGALFIHGEKPDDAFNQRNVVAGGKDRRH